MSSRVVDWAIQFWAREQYVIVIFLHSHNEVSTGDKTDNTTKWIYNWQV